MEIKNKIKKLIGVCTLLSIMFSISLPSLSREIGEEEKEFLQFHYEEIRDEIKLRIDYIEKKEPEEKSKYEEVLKEYQELLKELESEMEILNEKK